MIVVKNKLTIILLIISIITVIALTCGITYAYLSFSAEQTQANVLETACFNTTFSEGTTRINEVGYPISSAKGLTKTPYTFTIKNNCSNTTSYKVYINVLNGTDTALLNVIDYSIDGKTSAKLSTLKTETLPAGATTSSVKTTYVLDTSTLAGLNATKTYNLRLWIDEAAGNDIMGLQFSAEVLVYTAL